MSKDENLQQASYDIFKGINKIAPRYFCEKFNLVNQRIIEILDLQYKTTLLFLSNTFANRTFINSSTSDWNKLPAQLKISNFIVTFLDFVRDDWTMSGNPGSGDPTHSSTLTILLRQWSFLYHLQV